jgi:hypothetical protein
MIERLDDRRRHSLMPPYSSSNKMQAETQQRAMLLGPFELISSKHHQVRFERQAHEIARAPITPTRFIALRWTIVSLQSALEGVAMI